MYRYAGNMFSDLSGDAPGEILPGIQLLRATREPCLVCGHPTGDCADGAELPHVIFGANVEHTPGAPIDVLVPEDIFGERQITPFTRARVLLAAKGTYVTADRAVELGIL